MILFNVEKGSEGCLNITTGRPHEFFDHTGLKITLLQRMKTRLLQEEHHDAYFNGTKFKMRRFM